MKELSQVYHESECIICYHDYIPSKSNYKCTNIKCLEKICNSCLEEHLKYSKQCVFCRDILDIRYKIDKSQNHTKSNDILYSSWPYLFCTILFTGWMIFMHTYCSSRKYLCNIHYGHNITNSSNQNLQ